MRQESTLDSLMLRHVRPQVVVRTSRILASRSCSESMICMWIGTMQAFDTFSYSRTILSRPNSSSNLIRLVPSYKVSSHPGSPSLHAYIVLVCFAMRPIIELIASFLVGCSTGPSISSHHSSILSIASLKKSGGKWQVGLI